MWRLCCPYMFTCTKLSQRGRYSHSVRNIRRHCDLLESCKINVSPSPGTKFTYGHARQRYYGEHLLHGVPYNMISTFTLLPLPKLILTVFVVVVVPMYAIFCTIFKLSIKPFSAHQLRWLVVCCRLDEATFLSASWPATAMPNVTLWYMRVQQSSPVTQPLFCLSVITCMFCSTTVFVSIATKIVDSARAHEFCLFSIALRTEHDKREST